MFLLKTNENVFIKNKTKMFSLKTNENVFIKKTWKCFYYKQMCVCET